MKVKRKQQTKFDCYCCGACCRCLGIIFGKDFELCDPDGVCKYLDRDTNLCTIYDDRPLLCRVDELYDSGYFDSYGLTREEYYKLTRENCELLKKLVKDDNTKK